MSRSSIICRVESARAWWSLGGFLPGRGRPMRAFSGIFARRDIEGRYFWRIFRGIGTDGWIWCILLGWVRCLFFRINLIVKVKEKW